MNRLSKVANILLGLFLAPLYMLEEREQDMKLREIGQIRRKAKQTRKNQEVF